MYASGNRQSSRGSRKYIKLDQAILVHSSDRCYLIVALSNAVERLAVENEGERLLRMGNLHKESLTAAVGWRNLKTDLYHVRYIHHTEEISWMVEKGTGIFVVRLLVKDGLRRVSHDHVVSICIYWLDREIGLLGNVCHVLLKSIYRIMTRELFRSRSVRLRFVKSNKKRRLRTPLQT